MKPRPSICPVCEHPLHRCLDRARHDAQLDRQFADVDDTDIAPSTPDPYWQRQQAREAAEKAKRDADEAAMWRRINRTSRRSYR